MIQMAPAKLSLSNVPLSERQPSNGFLSDARRLHASSLTGSGTRLTGYFYASHAFLILFFELVS